MSTLGDVGEWVLSSVGTGAWVVTEVTGFYSVVKNKRSVAEIYKSES